MKHILFTLYDCNSNLLNNEQYIRQLLYDTTCIMGATFINTYTHKFEPYGVTAVTLLAESHISIHTWPEYNMAVCDVFTCGDVNPRRGAIYMGMKLESKDYTSKIIDRDKT